MLKNKNIFISLEIEKNLETKALVLNIHLNSTAPNFLIEDEVMHWNPTLDEIDFVSEVVGLLENHRNQHISDEEDIRVVPSDEKTSTQLPHPSDSVPEAAIDPDFVQPLTKTEKDEKIFVQADEKKIDEIIRRKKSGFSEEYVIESNDKSRIDRMLKQKKKKE